MSNVLNNPIFFRNEKIFDLMKDIFPENTSLAFSKFNSNFNLIRPLGLQLVIDEVNKAANERSTHFRPGRNREDTDDNSLEYQVQPLAVSLPYKLITNASLNSLSNINSMSFNWHPQQAKFFVIRPFCEDDVHKSLKYSIWSSSQIGNKTLDIAFLNMQHGGPVYLFFSVHNSDHFCGVAQMTTGLDYTQVASCWQSQKRGQFSVSWVFVKDLPNGDVQHIKIRKIGNKPLTATKDTQEIEYQTGCEVLKMFYYYPATNSLLQRVGHYDELEKKSKN